MEYTQENPLRLIELLRVSAHRHRHLKMWECRIR